MSRGGYRTKNFFFKKPDTKEKAIAIFAYLSGGLVGFIYLIVKSINNSKITHFENFHCLQSIILGFLLYFSDLLIRVFLSIIKLIPVINEIFIYIYGILYSLPVFWGYTPINLIVLGLFLYLIITSAMGLFSYLPFLSNVIKKMIGY